MVNIKSIYLQSSFHFKWYVSVCAIISQSLVMWGYMTLLVMWCHMVMWKRFVTIGLAYPVAPPHPTPSMWTAVFYKENVALLCISTLSKNTAKTSEIWVAELYFERQTEAALYYCWKIHDHIENHSRTNSPFLGM